MTRSPLPQFTSPEIEIRSWASYDEPSFDPRSAYVERYWLGILGPATTLLLRYLAEGLDRNPDGFTIEASEVAGSMGLKGADHRSSFQRSLTRACLFGLAQSPSPELLLVRRTFPALSTRHLERLPQSLQESHSEITSTPNRLIGEDLGNLAELLIKMGRDFTEVDSDLARWGVSVQDRSEAMYSVWEYAS